MDVFESLNKNIYIIAGSSKYSLRIYQISRTNIFRQISKINNNSLNKLLETHVSIQKIMFLSDEYVSLTTQFNIYIFKWQEIINNNSFESYHILNEIKLVKSFKLNLKIINIDYHYINYKNISSIFIIIAHFNEIILYETIINENDINNIKLDKLRIFEERGFSYLYNNVKYWNVSFSKNNKYEYPDCISYTFSTQHYIYEKINNNNKQYILKFECNINNDISFMNFLGNYSLLTTNNSNIYLTSCAINDKYFTENIQNCIRKCLNIDWDLSFIVKYILLYLSRDWKYFNNNIKSNNIKSNIIKNNLYLNCIDSCSMSCFLGRNIFIVSNAIGQLELYSNLFS